MNMATTRASTRPTPYSRSSVRSTPQAGTVEAVSFASSQRFSATTVQPPSAMRDIMDIVGGVTLVMGLLIGLATLALFTRDSMAVGKALSDQSSAQSSMICKDGRMAHGDGSLPDIVFEDGVFVCTDWRTLQAIETEEQARGIRR